MIDNSFITDVYGTKTDAYLESKKNLTHNPTYEKLAKVSSEFESLLIYEMFKEMNKNISLNVNEEDGNEETFMGKKNQGEKIFNDFLTYERGRILAEGKTMSLGLSDAIIKEFTLSDVSRETLDKN